MKLDRPSLRKVSNAIESEKAGQTFNPERGNPFEIARTRLRLSQQELARKLNTSLYALVRWEQGDLTPSDDVMSRLNDLLRSPHKQPNGPNRPDISAIAFASSG